MKGSPTDAVLSPVPGGAVEGPGLGVGHTELHCQDWGATSWLQEATSYKEDHLQVLS